ncbi:hypothetical protein BC830DRAFT_853854 [Chytriomyces sp. MP71]|nr:hypothetical protein BC830DRAFT_853854 [Chytriomyces sp. MP71]
MRVLVRQRRWVVEGSVAGSVTTEYVDCSPGSMVVCCESNRPGCARSCSDYGRTVVLQYWLQSLMAEHFALFSQAVDMYKKALDIAFEHAVDNIAYSNCMYNPLLSKETIKARLQTLSLEHHLRTAESTFEAGDFHVVYSMLHPLLFQDAFFGQWLKSVFFPDYARAEQENHAFLVSTLSLELGADQRLRALRMLSKCYFELDMVTESFMCRLLLLATELQSALDSKKLISSLKQISKLMKTILESMLLNEHEDLFQIMKDSAAVKPILAFMNLPNVSSVFALCVSCVFALVRLSWVIVKQCGFGRYRTDATLVNFSVRSWCLMFYLCKSLESDCEDRENIGMEWAFFAHQQLGEVSLCGRDNGILLKLITRHCIAKEGGESMVELYQALCCNYGTVITVCFARCPGLCALNHFFQVDPDYPLLEHNSPTAPFTKASAAIIFSPLCKFLKCHLRTRNHRAISTDIRDAVDTIGEKFPEPPIRQHEVAYNRSLIDKFLSSDIQRRQTNPIGAMHLDPDKIPYLNVYRDLYYIRGKLACIQKRAIIGIKTKKSFENLESASEDYVHNLVVNPFSINAWILAADTFCSLSYEYLSWSASDLLANLELIRNLQVKSYHCYEQAIALLKNRNCTVFDDGQIESDLSTSERAMLIWGNFGFLCYSMVAQPMNGLATKSSRWKSNEAWIMRYSELAGTEGEPLEPNFRGRDDILQRGMECFKRAQQIDSTEWRFPFMMAKIAAMMNADFRNIVSHFKLAITLLPEEWATKEQENILDVHYCLISYLCKGLHTQKLEAPFVLNCLDDISLNKDGGLSPIDIEPQSDSSLVAYQRILQELGYMKSLDKKKWQHRPYWKSHWILRTIFNDPERAKNDLLNIFQLRSNARSYINFWRPEFERPGRHFVYVHKYTLSLISILRDCKDLESLRHLVRKCQKASDVLLYPQTIWKAGFDAVVDILSEKVTDSIWVQFVKSIPQKEFLAHAPPIEKKMFGGSADEKVESASLLHSAFNLKKLNENMEDETVLSRILVQLYCKLFLANMNVVANVEENETLSEDTSLYFTIVLRRCLIACKIPWSKRAAAEEAQQEPDASVAPASEKSKEPTDIQTTKAGNEEFRISHPDLVMELPDDASPDENADSGIIQKVAGKDFGDTSNTDMEVANL